MKTFLSQTGIKQKVFPLCSDAALRKTYISMVMALFLNGKSSTDFFQLMKIGTNADLSEMPGGPMLCFRKWRILIYC